MSTTVYNIDDNGNISTLATYSLSPKQSLKNAYHQFIQKNFNTWDYSTKSVDIKESENGFSIFYNRNSSLFVKKS